MRYRLIAAAFFYFVLTSCTAATKTQKIDANASNVKDIQILIVLGDLPDNKAVTLSQRSFHNQQLKPALASRFLQIFQANGVLVDSIIFEDDTGKNHLTIQNIIRNAKTSHVLTLSVENHLYSGRFGIKSELLGVGL